MEQKADFLLALAEEVCKGTSLQCAHPKHLGCLVHTTIYDQIIIWCDRRVEKIHISMRGSEEEDSQVVIDVVDSCGNPYESIGFMLEVLDPEIVREFAIKNYLKLLNSEKDLLKRKLDGCQAAIDAAEGRWLAAVG